MASTLFRHLPTLALCGLAALATIPAASAQPVSGEEYAAIGYNGVAHDNPVARLAARLDSGEVTLEYKPERGYLDALLRELGIDPSSQVLVYSPTSLQYLKIGPRTPRALFFSDNTYVGFVQKSDIIELTTMDEKFGAVFYVFHNAPKAPRRIERENQRCLVCHDSTGTMGGGIPVIAARSGLYDRTGFVLRDLTGDGNTTDRTPVAERWGGWYVTGREGNQAHLGNVFLENASQLEQVDSFRRGNLETLEGNEWFDVSPYPRPTSDIVALMVMEHQLTVQNQVTYVKFKAPVVLQRIGHPEAAAATSWNELPPKGQSALTRMLDNLVRNLMLVDAAPLDDTIASTSGYTEWFEAQGTRDSHGRSLRDLDLTRRLFTYPLSFLVGSPDVDTLPPYAREYVYGKIAAILNGHEHDAPFNRWSPAELQVTREIARQTVPALQPYLAAPHRHEMSGE